MYEAVRTVPEGQSTAARHAATAADYGYEGVVVRNHGDATREYDPDAIREEYDVDVVTAIEVRTDDPAWLGGFIGSHRPNVTVLCVHGGERRVNRLAVERPRVDVLSHPMRDGGDLDHVLAKTAAENGVRLEVDLSPVLRERGGSRVRAIRALRKLRDLIEQYEAPYVVSAEARSHLELRAPRELAAVGAAVGFTPEQVREGLAEWGRLAGRNRERRSGEYVGPGVRRGRHGGDG